MTMHLHHPSLSLNGKRKGKVKFASADAKRKSEQLDKEWKELLKRQGVEAEDRKRRRALSAEPLVYSLAVPEGRSNKHIKSLNSGLGVATLKPQQVYTGDKMLGIGQLHKSNAVPVFSSDDAKDISKMRR
jgi:hypothetical protein